MTISDIPYISWLLLLIVSFLLSFNHPLIPTNAILNPAVKPILSFCGGRYYACALFDDYKLKCWGMGNYIGRISSYGGSTSTVGSNIPYFDPGTSFSVTMVGCSGSAFCALLNTGDVKCSGGNGDGECGIGNTTAFVGEKSGHVGDLLPIVNLGNGVYVTSVTGGRGHFCVLTSDSKVKCYGDNVGGILGLGDTTDRGQSAALMGDSLPFVNLGSNVEVASVHAGAESIHTCAILSAPVGSEQRIKCWGMNTYYQLGYGDANNRGDSVSNMGDSLTLVDLGTESKVKNLAIGYIHNCALRVDDVFKCWGYGLYGQLGSGSTATISSTGNSIPSVPIDSGKTIKLIHGFVHNTCIVYDDLITMKCVGYNDKGQLGQGDTTQRGHTPTTTYPNISAIDLGTGSLKILSIHGFLGSICVIFENYSVKCFGSNSNGQLGIGTTLTIGDQPYELGTNLTFAELLSPTQSPTTSPTISPSSLPTNPPTVPTYSPSRSPTRLPTKTPTMSPSSVPTTNPSKKPTATPTTAPTSSPSTRPTRVPSKTPTQLPTINPTQKPSKSPSTAPTNHPTSSPTQTM